jgi:hypothetical protein
MAVIKLNRNPPDRELRQFAVIFFLFSLVVATIAYFADSTNVAAGALTLGVLIGGIGYIRVAFVRPIYLGWMYAAYPIGWVVSHTILAIVFYLLVTPVGWLMKLFRYDPLERRLESSATTYWTPIEARVDKTSYFRQF